MKMSRFQNQFSSALLAILLSGCIHTESSHSSAGLPPAKPEHVDFENVTARTKSIDSASSMTPDELIARIQDLLRQENSPARIYRLVQRFPDAALEALRNTGSSQATQPAWLALSTAYDQAFITTGSKGWTAVFADVAAHPREYDAVHQARQQALQYIEMGRPEEVFKDPSIKGVSAESFAGAELLRIRGIAAVLCDRPTDALGDWQKASSLAAADRSVSAEIFLLDSEGLRRTGKSTGAVALWSSAAIAAIDIHDPGLWQRLLDMRTEEMNWPKQVAGMFESRLNANSTTQPVQPESVDGVRVDACIWRQIGEWRLARGEVASALLAFKQAESLFTTPRDAAESRIAQARALMIMNQSGAAVSILTSLTADPDPMVNHHAMAVLSNARLATEDVPGALDLLTRAVADDDSFPAAMRAPARADLGLVLLMSSREQEGLNWLHRAQSDFQQDNNHAGLCQCLQNEAAYLEKVGRTEEAKAVIEHMFQVAAIP
jgi:tetratricopeptide (TPR) repeat protein